MNTTTNHIGETIRAFVFANPELAQIANSSQIKLTKSIWNSIYHEMSWLFLAVLILYSISQSIYLLTLPKLTASSPLATALATILNLIISYSLITKTIFRAKRLAKRYRINNLSRLIKDGRAPVLYLRSFNDENIEQTKRRSLKTPEEDLSSALNAVGPVIMVGKPDDDLSPLGAIRIYLKDENWQENVKKLMSISQLVVIQAGTSKGLQWEIETIFCNVAPKKLLISFLNWENLEEEIREKQYKQFKKQIVQVLNNVKLDVSSLLPQKIGNIVFVIFDERWKPELIVHRTWKKILYKFSVSTLVNETLQPHLRKRNIKLARWKTILYIYYVAWLIAGLLFAVAIVLAPSDDLSRWIANKLFLVLGVFFPFSPIAILIILGWILTSVVTLIFNSVNKIVFKITGKGTIKENQLNLHE